MSGEPRVTVVIPTFNRAPLLVAAIESVLGQSYRDLEIVVCDDGSIDDTAACVEAFGAPVRYLPLPHTGCPGAPRNRGIEAARGELVAFLDDDDLWEPEKLARQVELLDRESLDLVYSDRKLLVGDGSAPQYVISPAPAAPDRFLEVVLHGHFPSVCTVLVRRRMLRRAGGFDEALVTGEDLDLWLRLAPIVRAGRVAEPLVAVNRRPGSLSDRSGPLTFHNAVSILERSLASRLLTPSERKICRVTLTRLRSRYAVALRARGDAAEALRAALRAVRHQPASRAAWGALARTLAGTCEDRLKP